MKNKPTKHPGKKALWGGIRVQTESSKKKTVNKEKRGMHKIWGYAQGWGVEGFKTLTPGRPVSSEKKNREMPTKRINNGGGDRSLKDKTITGKKRKNSGGNQQYGSAKERIGRRKRSSLI